MTGLLRKIGSRGYWHVIIRPSKYKKKRIEDISALFPLLEKLKVRWRGWDFPHLNYNK